MDRSQASKGTPADGTVTRSRASSHPPHHPESASRGLAPPGDSSGEGRFAMVHAVSLLVLLYGVWLVLSGHYTPLLLSLGLASCVLVVFLARRMELADREGVPLNMALRFLLYLPWLTWEVFKSNVAVARVILSPSLPIQPTLVRFEGHQKTDLGRFLYANSITLTPGTITVRLDRKFHVHALTRAAVDGTEEGSMDRKVCWVEGSR